jgi:hypothetical protein
MFEFSQDGRRYCNPQFITAALLLPTDSPRNRLVCKRCVLNRVPAACVTVHADGFVVMGAKSCQLWAVSGLQEPRATRLPRIPGLGALQGNSSSSSSNVASGSTADKFDGGSVCLAVLEPRCTLSSGLEVSCAVLQRQCICGCIVVWFVLQLEKQGLQEPCAMRLSRIPGLGALQGSSSSNVASGSAGDKADGSSVYLAVLEPRFTLSSGLEVSCAVLQRQCVCGCVDVWFVVQHEKQGLQEPRATQLPYITGLGALPGNSSSSSSVASGRGGLQREC